LKRSIHAGRCSWILFQSSSTSFFSTSARSFPIWRTFSPVNFTLEFVGSITHGAASSTACTSGLISVSMYRNERSGSAEFATMCMLVRISTPPDFGGVNATSTPLARSSSTLL